MTLQRVSGRPSTGKRVSWLLAAHPSCPVQAHSTPFQVKNASDFNGSDKPLFPFAIITFAPLPTGLECSDVV